MPFINVKLNSHLPEQKESVLKAKLGEAISTFPGKSEYWLMIHFEDDCKLWFRGYNNFPIVMVEIKLFGAATDEVCAEMTRTVTRIFSEELGLSPDRIYVKYEFCDRWGWNGENF